MSPQEFIHQWESQELDGLSKLVVYPAGALAGLSIPPDSIEFLTVAGLPDSAAPCLGFGSIGPDWLPSVAETWRQPRHFSRFRIIGSNGSGDPICIDLLAGAAVVYLNHDDAFDRIFMNTSAAHLAEFLLAFRSLVHESNTRIGDEAFFDGNIPEDVLRQCIKKMNSADPPAMSEGCFWHDEIQPMLK